MKIMCYHCLNNCFKIFLEIGVFLISGLILLLAYKIYKNFDIKKSFLKEQLKTVCELSNQLYDFGLPTRLISGGTASNYPRFFKFFDQQGVDTYQNIYFTTHRVDDILPLINYQHNILTPKSIAEIIKEFDVNIYQSMADNKMPDKYILIFPINENQDKTEKSSFYFYMEYEKFYTLSVKLVKAITNWLTEYGAKEINLPIYMKEIKI